MPRICIVRHAYFPDDPRDRKQALALVEAGFEVDLLCLRKPGQSSSETVHGVRVFRIPLTHQRAGIFRYFGEYALSFFLFSLNLNLRCFSRPYDCIQISTMPDFLIFAALLPKLLGAKLLIDLHEPTPELWLTKYGEQHGILYQMQTAMEKLAIRFADYCITVTETLRARFVERGADQRKFTVIPNVCEESFDLAAAPADAQNERFELITHGLIEKRYGHELVIRAVAGLKTTHPEISYTIAGAGEHSEYLQALVTELDCSAQVQFLGFLPFNELLDRLNQADAGVIAMERSPYSELIDTNKMYEYIALGKPVIISRLPAVEANFPDTSLQYFTPGDVDDLARAIGDLCRDRSRGEELVRQSSQIYQTVRWRETKKLYVSVINKMI